MLCDGKGRRNEILMHGHLSDQRWHMLSSTHSFLVSKDGRKISNGDCALFRAGNAPPFIGIIRHQVVDEEGDVKLGVNWLYRPADVKLGKGASIDPLPPNEVFYSFHQDEISGASLLHPCKVAFLSKGVQLPSGVSAFVCRRVYDVTSKCLWWLTDQDYTNEHQEEVDQLLNKTKNEMQATMHSGGLSPRTVNSPTQLKSGSDSIQNGLFASQFKSKKRDRMDQNNNEMVKRSRFSKGDDSASGHLKQGCSSRPEEIMNITDKEGSLFSSASVEQLVHLMRQDRKVNIKKERDLVLHRTMLVGVVTTTDNRDCLSQFVQLGGLSILDDWLQELQKGKSGDSGSPKEAQKAHEDLLFLLLEALGKLPVDLEALKTCNVGKSVNHLRTHKNLEIQKKARYLVDAWKKRVDEDMKNNDSKSFPGHSTEITSKGLAPLVPASKAISNRIGQEDAGKLASVSLGSAKVSLSLSPTKSSKESHCKMPGFTGTTDLTVPASKEEKSSSSSQSQNNSQTCLSRHAKAASPVQKEDTQSSMVCSVSNKSSFSGSPRKISNKSVQSSLLSGSHKESMGGKAQLCSRNTSGEKDSHTGKLSDKGTDIARGDSSQSLIVRLPNPSRSATGSVNCGSNADKAIPGNQGLSPGKKEKQDVHYGKTKEQNILFDGNSSPEVNAEACQRNRTKSISAIPIEECSINGEDSEKMLEMCKMAQILSSGLGEREERKEDLAEGTVEIERRKYCEPSENSEGAGEGCSIHSQATAVSMDERGMNLLASIVVTEISKDENANVVGNSVTTSLRTGENLGQDGISGYDSKLNSPQSDDVVGQNGINMKKYKNDHDSTDHRDASRTNLDTFQNVEFTSKKEDALNTSTRVLETGNVAIVGEGIKGIIEDRIQEHPCSNCGGEQPRGEFCYDVEKLYISGKGGLASDCAKQSELETREEQEGLGGQKIQDLVNLQQAKVHVRGISVQGDGQGSSEHCLEKEKQVGNEDQEKPSEGYVPCTGASNSDVMEPNDCHSGLFDNDFVQVAHQVANKVGKEEGQHKQSDYNKLSDKDVEDISLSYEQNKSIDMLDAKEHHSTYGLEHEDQGKGEHKGNEHLAVARSITYKDDSQETLIEKTECMEPEQTMSSGEAADQGIGVTTSSDKKNVTTEMGSCTVPQSITVVPSAFVEHQEFCLKTEAAQSAWSNELPSSDQIMATAVPPAKYDGSNDSAERPAFDLNESIELDEAAQYDAAISTSASHLSVVPCTSASVPLTVSCTGLATPIAVVARSKGPFVPPINPVQSIAELGWKGSGATSAFRPAEPREITDLQHPVFKLPISYAAGFNLIGKGNRASLDIDLNVAYEKTSEDGVITVQLSSQICEPSTSSGCRDMSGKDFISSIAEPFAPTRPCSPMKSDLDLNRIDDSGENELIKMPLGTSAENFGLTLKTAISASSLGASCVLRDLDLNNGPTFDDSRDDFLPENFSSSSQPVADLRMKGELFNSSSWFSAGDAFQSLTIPLHFNDRTDHQVITTAASASQSNWSSLPGPNLFSDDIYKGKPPFSSDPIISFSNTTSKSYPFTGFPFGSSFPLNTPPFSSGPLSYPESLGPGCFPAAPSEVVPTGSLSSSHVRPYFISPMVASGTESSSTCTWPTPNLDLNTGPEMDDISYREERLVTREPSINCPVSLEQMKAFCHGPASGMSSKRKDPEEGWDVHRSGYEQSIWR